MGHIEKIKSMEDAQTNDARITNNDHRPLPVIDLGPLMRVEAGAVENIATAWCEACKNLGSSASSTTALTKR